jgi:hypothetical protein
MIDIILPSGEKENHKTEDMLIGRFVRYCLDLLYEHDTPELRANIDRRQQHLVRLAHEMHLDDAYVERAIRSITVGSGF